MDTRSTSMINPVRMINLSAAQIFWLTTALATNTDDWTLGDDGKAFLRTNIHKLLVTMWPDGDFTIATWD